LPDFPDRFDSIEAARLFCRTFFAWYNDEHHHTGLGLHTAADVHYGTAEQTREKRAGVLEGAYAAHPERFVRKQQARSARIAGSRSRRRWWRRTHCTCSWHTVRTEIGEPAARGTSVNAPAP
jgi:hypothetical protein